MSEGGVARCNAPAAARSEIRGPPRGTPLAPRRRMLRSHVVIAGAAVLTVAAGCASRSAAQRGTETVDAGAALPASEPPAPVVADRSAAAAERLAALGPVYFEFDSHLLTQGARNALTRAVDLLPELDAVLLAGHADERGTTQYNLALGARRAEAVRAYLVELGADPARLRTVSYGEEHPAADGDGEHAWAKNRRVELEPRTGTM